MSLVARPAPGFHGPSRRTLIVALAVVAFLGLGGGGIYLATQLAGHGGGPSGAIQTPLPTATPTPTPELTGTPSPEPTASPSPTPPPSVLASLQCTIAVAGRWAPGSGGFLSFPGGGFRADPTSAVTAPDGGFYGLSHVLAMNKWAPVPRDWVTPDGTRYAYITWDAWTGAQSIRLVRADGSSSSLGLPVPGAATGPRLSNAGWTLLSAESDGIYVAPGYWSGEPGLWRVGYDGQIKRIAADGYWQAVGYGYAYGTVTSAVPEGAANVLVRLSLAGGSRSDYFTQPGLAARVFGFDAAGNPVVQGKHGDQAEIWLAAASPVELLSQPFDPTGIGAGQGGGPSWLEPGLVGLSAVGDSHGLWIATTKGLYIYTAQAGLERASDVAGPLGSTCR